MHPVKQMLTMLAGYGDNVVNYWKLLKIADNFDDSIDDKVDHNIDILLTQCWRQSWRRCWQQFWLHCWRQCRRQFWRQCWQQCWKCWHCLMALLSQSDTSNDYKGKMVPPQIIIIMITKAKGIILKVMVEEYPKHIIYKKNTKIQRKTQTCRTEKTSQELRMLSRSLSDCQSTI